MSEINIANLVAERYYSSPVIVGGSIVIALPPCCIKQEQIDAIKRWGFKTVSIEEKEELKPVEPVKVLAAAETEEIDLSEFDDSAKPAASSAISTDSVNFETEEVDISAFSDDADSVKPSPAKASATPAKSSASLTTEPVVFNDETPASSQQVTKRSHSALSDFVQSRTVPEKPVSEMGMMKEADDEKKIQMVQKRYDEFFEYIFSVYTRYATHKEFEIKVLNEKTLELCNFVREYKNYILRLSPSIESRNKNFLVSHSLRSAIYSIVIGQQLKMPYDKLVELGVTAILHEVGQIRLPPQLYMTDKRLSPAEMAKLRTHSVLGFQIVKECGFPLAVQLGVLEHHERETGIGYPRKLSGEKITLYAKIIAVACSFEAITAPRQFKEARTTYEGMVEMLKNSTHLYDDTVVKALLYSISLFPIGAYVYLANGKIAQVVDVAPSNPKNPIIHIIGEKNEDGTIKTVQSDDGLMRIMRVLNNKEMEDLKKAMKK